MSDDLISLTCVNSLQTCQRIYVGFSGGCDSTVLLHLLSQSPELASKVTAVHINHGLHPDAGKWQAHCKAISVQFGIGFKSFSVMVSNASHVEESARIARYQVFEELLTEHDALVLGHHQNDQAETFLFRLLRGAGVDGLSAIPGIRPISKGTLYRPLLECPRVLIDDYAQSFGLKWINDSSNFDSTHARNFLRHEIIPLLESRWPKAVSTIARAAQNCSSAAANNQKLAFMDCPALENARSPLSIEELQKLSYESAVNVVRVWLKQYTSQMLSAKLLKSIFDQIIASRRDASPEVRWKNFCIKRYQHKLYLIEDAAHTQLKPVVWESFPAPIPHQLSNEHQIIAKPDLYGVPVLPGQMIEIRYRQGGETIFINKQTKRLKKLMQEWSIPPWERDRIPLIFINNQLVAVVGYAVQDHCVMEHARYYVFELAKIERAND